MHDITGVTVFVYVEGKDADHRERLGGKGIWYRWRIFTKTCSVRSKDYCILRHVNAADMLCMQYCGTTLVSGL